MRAHGGWPGFVLASVLSGLAVAACSDSVTSPGPTVAPVLSVRSANETSTTGVPMLRLPQLVDEPASAEAINERGDVAGFAFMKSGPPTRAYLWPAHGGIQDIGDLGLGSRTWARGLNDRGEVVGSSYTASGEQHAFMWTDRDGMRDLGAPSPYGSSAAGSINNRGQVAAVGGGRGSISVDRA